MTACGNGKDGTDGRDGSNAGAIVSLMVCDGALERSSPWDGTSLLYQRASMESGDVHVSVQLRGVRMGYAHAFYKVGMEGAKDGGVTVKVDELPVFVYMYGIDGLYDDGSPGVLAKVTGETSFVNLEEDACKAY